MNKKEVKQFLDKIVRVEWWDVVGKQGVKNDYIGDINMNPSSWLDIVVTYGILEKMDETSIMIITEDGEDTSDFTVIPISLITDIKELIVKGG